VVNGVYNLIFIVFLLIMLVAFDYVYSIADIIINQINVTITPNHYSTIGYNSYTTVRDFMYSIVTGIVVPFLLFLTFISSVINKNQNIIVYLIQVIALLMLTPLAIYMFGDLMTNLLNVSILDTHYMATLYFTNFPYILIANSLMALLSFMFVQRPAAVGY